MFIIMKNLIKKIIDFLNNILPKWEPSLMRLVEKERKISEEYKKLLKKKLDSQWFSKNEIIFVVVSFVVFFFLTHLQTAFDSKGVFENEFIKRLLLSKETAHYQNLIAIHAGIGAVLVALAFFIAQEIVKTDQPYKGIVLVRRSRFFALLVAEILFFFQFIWGSVNILSVLPIAIIALYTIKSLYEAIRLIANNFSLRKEEEALFYEATRINFLKILDFEIIKRLGNNKLYEKVGRFESVIDASPFTPIQEDDYFAIKTDKEGFVSDINLNKLNKLISSFSKNQIKKHGDLVDAEIQTVQNQKIGLEPPCRIVPFFYSSLKQYDNVLFWIRKDAVKDEEEKEKVSHVVKGIFSIEKEFDLETETRDEVIKLKIRCINAIKDLKTDELEKLVVLYVELIKEFYSYLKFYGGGFSNEQAEKERGTFSFERLKPLEWLSRDIRDIFDRAIQSKDIDIIRHVAYLPILFAQQAIDNKDHLIFQEFLYFPQLLYLRSIDERKNGNDRLSEIMFDRSWRYLKELVDYHLEPKYKKDRFSDDDFRGFGLYVLKTFQSILKSALDNNDILGFQKFLNVAKKLFHRIERDYKMRSEDDSEKMFELIDGKRNEMIFGFGAWILHLFGRDPSNLKLMEFYRDISGSLPHDIKNFTQIFLEVHDFNAEKFWGWDNWEMSMNEEGEVHCIQILEKLERFFVVRALGLLRGKTKEEADKIDLPHNRDLAFLAEGTRDAMKTIDDIEKNPEKWEFVLDEQAVKQCENLRALLKRAHELQEQADLKRKREAKISNEKVDKFKKGVVGNYYQSYPIREILKSFGHYEDKSDKPYKGNKKKIGINTVFDKAAFFGDDVSWHVHYTGMDEAFGYGRSMAYGENEQILEAIDKKVTPIGKEQFDSTLALIKTSNIVILATNQAIWDFFERGSGNYIPKWNRNFPQDLNATAIEGVYKFKRSLLPVYQIFTTNAGQSKIYILDKSKIGKYIQYSPLDVKDSQESLRDAFLIDVQQFERDNDLMAEFLQKPTKWLEEEGDREKQIEYLQERVLIHIFERYEFQLHKNFVGYLLVTDNE